MFGDDELIKLHRKRSTQIANIIVLCFGIVLLRLYYLQIYKGELYHRFSIENRLRKEILRSPRGMVFSRNKTLIVDNIPRFDAILTRQFLKDKKETLKKIAGILDMKVPVINKIIKKNSFQARYRPIILKKNISMEEVSKIEMENSSLPGISVETFISREYRDKEVGAHLLGYISEISQEQLPRYKKRDNINYHLGDFIGQFGLEEQLDKSLRGENGYEYVEVDALGRKKRYINTDNLFKGIKGKSPKPGYNVMLTIDEDMQKAGYEALIKPLKDSTRPKVGSVVAIDVKTGEVLTMVSTPSFDPSQFSRGLTSEYWSSLVNNPEKPLRDRNIQDHFSPGSTFKPFTAIAALEEGIIDGRTKIRCHGSFKFGRRVYRSWKRWGTEKVSIEDALKQSCNIFFYKVATDLDIDVLHKYASMFGFGKRTGVNLPREVSGLFPSKEWKLKRNGKVWQKGETLSCSIGQSYVLATTMQLANAYAAIANKGTLFKPYTIKKIFNNAGETIKEFTPQIANKIELKKSTWKYIHKGLYKVVNDPKGTAWWRRGLGNQMAGKTGTSQVIRAQSEEQLYSKCRDMEYKYRHHGVFVGFAPYDDPQIAVAALVEHGCGGSSAAAPVVERVVNTYMKKYFPEKQKAFEVKERKEFSRFIKKRNEERNKKEE